MRTAIGAGLLVTLVGCLEGKVNLGGNDDGGASTLPAQSASPQTVAIATCDGNPNDNPAFLGTGFVAMRPASCTAPSGSAHAVASVADVTRLIVGTWFSCADSLFGINVLNTRGVQFTSDGHYGALSLRPDQSLVPDAADDTDGGVSNPAVEGTFEVVDGSATYGAGTYALQLHPNGGGLFSGQVLVTDSPLQLHYFALNAGELVFAPAGTWAPRAGVCTCSNATGTKVSGNDAVALAAAMQGRWLWCGSDNPPWQPASAITLGIEFAADGTWYALEEDATGRLVRGTGADDHGTFLLMPALPEPSELQGPEPLDLEFMSETGGQVTGSQVVVTENPRALFLNVGSASAPGGGWMPLYSILSPLP